MMKIKKIEIVYSIVTILLLTACGSGGSTTTSMSTVEKTSGQVIDAPVANITYKCDGESFKTDENGTFACTVFPVAFFIGNIKLGSIAEITPDAKVYPQDIAGVGRDDFSNDHVLKIGYILQVFDTDGDISKTIEIDESVVVSDAKDLKDLAFSDIDNIIRTSGKIPLDIEDVRTHMIDNADAAVDGTVAKDTQAVNRDAKALTLGDLSNVTGDLSFPTTGDHGTKISYVISTGTAISSTGVVTRPSFSAKSQTVTIDATITKGNAKQTRTFSANVLALPINDLESVTLAQKALNIAGTLSAVDGDLELLTVGLHAVQVSWESTNSAIGTDGTVTRPSYSKGNSVGTLIAMLTKGSERVTKSFDVTVLKLAISPSESVANVKASLGLEGIEALQNSLILATLIDGVTLTWTTSDGSVIGSDGTIYPDNYQGSDKTATLTVTFEKEGVSDSKTFNVVVPKALMTDGEAVDLALSTLEVPTTNKIDEVYTYKIDLPTSKENAVTVTWSSDNSSQVETNGDITKAALSSGGFVDVALVSTVTKNATSKTKTFPIRVHIDPTADEAIAYEMDDFNLTTEDYSRITDAELFTMPIITSYLGVGISYTSSDTSVFTPDENGDKPVINRASFTDGDKNITITALFSLYDVTERKEFNLTIKSLLLSDGEAVSNVIQTLTLGDTTAITTNLTLPSNMNGVAIVWTTTDGTVINSSGVISPDSYTGVDKTATLTATLTSGEVTSTKDFVVTVLKLALTDAQRVAFDKDTLDLGNTSNINSSLTLPTTGSQGSTITWSSSDITVVSNTGVVTQSTYTIGSKSVTLIATISKGSVSETKSFSVIVSALPISDIEAVNLAKSSLTLGDTNNVTSNLTLVTTLANGVIVSWTSTDVPTVSTTGVVTQPTYTIGNKTTTLTATFVKGSASEIKEFIVVVPALAMSNAEAINLAKEALTLGDTTSVTENLTLPTTGLHGTTVIYSSGNSSVLSDSGVVNRPSFGNADTTVILTATISKNGVSDTKSFTVVVKQEEPEVPNF